MHLGKDPKDMSDDELLLTRHTLSININSIYGIMSSSTNDSMTERVDKIYAMIKKIDDEIERRNIK